MRCRRIVAHLHGSVTTSPISGFACSGGAARGRLHVGTNREVGRRVAPENAYPPSLAQRALRRQSPKVGAVCPNRARTDLCGRSVMGVPTAIFRLAERHPALAHAVMAPLICWSFSNSMFRYLLVDHAVPVMWRSLAAARLSAD